MRLYGYPFFFIKSNSDFDISTMNISLESKTENGDGFNRRIDEQVKQTQEGRKKDK